MAGEGIPGRATCWNDSTKAHKGVFLCSRCGCNVDIAQMESLDYLDVRYCPGCGARVVGRLGSQECDEEGEDEDERLLEDALHMAGYGLCSECASADTTSYPGRTYCTGGLSASTYAEVSPDDFCSCFVGRADR